MALAWDSFLDVHSSIVRYEIAVGTSVGSDDVHSFEGVGLQTTATAAPLTMTGGGTYYASVKAVDMYGNHVIASSDPIIVDGSAPSNQTYLHPSKFILLVQNSDLVQNLKPQQNLGQRYTFSHFRG